MAGAPHSRLWLISLVLALSSNAVATVLTLSFDDGTTFVETNQVMQWELAFLRRWVPIFARLMLAGVYCGIWYFTIRRPASSDVKRFMSFILFFIPALTLQDAVGDISLVFAGIPLLPLQGIEFSAAVYAAAFVLSQWRFGQKREGKLLA